MLAQEQSQAESTPQPLWLFQPIPLQQLHSQPQMTNATATAANMVVNSMLLKTIQNILSPKCADHHCLHQSEDLKNMEEMQRHWTRWHNGQPSLYRTVCTVIGCGASFDATDVSLAWQHAMDVHLRITANPEPPQMSFLPPQFNRFHNEHLFDVSIDSSKRFLPAQDFIQNGPSTMKVSWPGHSSIHHTPLAPPSPVVMLEAISDSDNSADDEAPKDPTSITVSSRGRVIKRPRAATPPQPQEPKRRRSTNTNTLTTTTLVLPTIKEVPKRSRRSVAVPNEPTHTIKVAPSINPSSLIIRKPDQVIELHESITLPRVAKNKRSLQVPVIDPPAKPPLSLPRQKLSLPKLEVELTSPIKPVRRRSVINHKALIVESSSSPSSSPSLVLPSQPPRPQTPPALPPVPVQQQQPSLSLSLSTATSEETAVVGVDEACESRRTAGKKKILGPKSLQNMLADSNSVFSMINLKRVLNYQTATTYLTDAERRSLLQHLPIEDTLNKSVDDVFETLFKANTFFNAALNDHTEYVAMGMFDPEMIAQRRLQQASARRRNKDTWKDEQYEATWGDKREITRQVTENDSITDATAKPAKVKRPIDGEVSKDKPKPQSRPVLNTSHMDTAYTRRSVELPDYIAHLQQGSESAPSSPDTTASITKTSARVEAEPAADDEEVHVLSPLTTANNAHPEPAREERRPTPAQFKGPTPTVLLNKVLSCNIDGSSLTALASAYESEEEDDE